MRIGYKKEKRERNFMRGNVRYAMVERNVRGG